MFSSTWLTLPTSICDDGCSCGIHIACHMHCTRIEALQQRPATLRVEYDSPLVLSHSQEWCPAKRFSSLLHAWRQGSTVQPLPPTKPVIKRPKPITKTPRRTPHLRYLPSKTSVDHHCLALSHSHTHTLSLSHTLSLAHSHHCLALSHTAPAMILSLAFDGVTDAVHRCMCGSRRDHSITKLTLLDPDHLLSHLCCNRTDDRVYSSTVYRLLKPAFISALVSWAEESGEDVAGLAHPPNCTQAIRLENARKVRSATCTMHSYDPQTLWSVALGDFLEDRRTQGCAVGLFHPGGNLAIAAFSLCSETLIFVPFHIFRSMFLRSWDVSRHDTGLLQSTLLVSKSAHGNHVSRSRPE